MSKKVIKAAGGISKGIAPTYYDGYENVGGYFYIGRNGAWISIRPKNKYTFP